MNIAFYSASTGMITQQDGMNIYSNNIANVNTVGYKMLRPSFADCIYTIQRDTEEGQDWQTGHGQFVNKTDFMWSQSGFQSTEQPLDYALPNDGFFQVTDSRGNSYLTRDGSFEISNDNEDNVWRLINGNSDLVLGYDGNPINVPFVTETDEEGNVIETDTIDYEALQDLIGVFTVPNNWGLEQSDGNHFVITNRSGQPVADNTLDKLSGSLEMSNVDLASEMVHIIESQRSFQLNAKIVQTADEFARIANNLR